MDDGPAKLLERAPAGLLGLLIAVIALALYGQALSFDFVNWDDPTYVTENPLVLAGVTPQGLVAIFSEVQVYNWHPLTMLSHMVDVELFGLDPAGHHATSLLLHALNSALLFLFLFLATGQKLPALLVGLLFAVHPTHVESVAWISERKDVLSTLFLLLALVAYVRVEAPARKMALVSLAIALGLMSKAMLVTAPVLFLLVDLWPLQRIRPPQRVLSPAAWWRDSGLVPCLLEKIPLVLLSLAFALITVRAQTEAFFDVDTSTRLGHALSTYGVYLLKLLQPVGLAAFYPHLGEPPLLRLLITVAVLVAVSALALLRVRREPWLLFGWSFFLVALLPVIGIVPVGAQGHADRYLYIPSIGIFVILAWGLHCAAHLIDRRLVALAPVLLLTVFTVQTLAYLPSWKHSVALWRRTLAVTDPGYLPFLESGSPNRVFSRPPQGLVVPYLNMGDALQEIGRVDEGVMHLQLAVGMQPENLPLRKRVGLILLETGRLETARAHFEETRALGLADEDIEAALAMLEARLGEGAEGGSGGEQP